jgi:hypothetical protein
MGFPTPDNDRHIDLISAYPFIHITVPTNIDRVGDSIDILMLVKYPVPSPAHDNN